MTTADTITCTGRAVDDTGTPVGEPCGRSFRRPLVVGAWRVQDDGTESWQLGMPVDDQTYIATARAAGWAIGPTGDAYCPQCRRPDPTLTRLCRDLTRSTR